MAGILMIMIPRLRLSAAERDQAARRLRAVTLLAGIGAGVATVALAGAAWLSNPGQTAQAAAPDQAASDGAAAQATPQPVSTPAPTQAPVPAVQPPAAIAAGGGGIPQGRTGGSRSHP